MVNFLTRNFLNALNAVVSFNSGLDAKLDAIREQNDRILRQQRIIMTGQDKLSAALAVLSGVASATSTAINTAVSELRAAKDNGDDAAFSAAADKVSNVAASLQASVDLLGEHHDVEPTTVTVDPTSTDPTPETATAIDATAPAAQ